MASRLGPGNHPKSFTRSYATVERDAEIARYCVEHTISQAAAHFGLNKSTVSRARQRAIDAAIIPAGTAAKGAELVKLDLYEQVALDVLRANHVYVSDGRIVRDDGQAITDHRPVLMAIDRLLRIAERRARLMGLDEPTRKVVEVITEDVIDAAIRAELTAMEALDATVGDRRPSPAGEAPTSA